MSARLPPPKLDRNVYDGGAAVSSSLRLGSQDGVREQVRLALTEAVRGVREGKRGCGAAARSQHRERHDARCEREPHAPGRPAAAPPRQTDRARQGGGQPQSRAPVEVWRTATHTHAATRRPPPSAAASRRPACVTWQASIDDRFRDGTTALWVACKVHRSASAPLHSLCTIGPMPTLGRCDRQHPNAPRQPNAPTKAPY